MRIVLGGVLLLAFGCAPPQITLDTSEMQAGALASSSTNIGLLEVQGVNRGTSFGVSVGSSFSENAYCTGSVFDDTTVVTTMDCLQNKFGSFDVRDMHFYLGSSNGHGTNSYTVSKVASVDGATRLAYLTLEQSIAVTGQAVSSLSAVPSSAELQAGIDSLTVSALAPNKDGVAKVVVATTRIATGYTAAPLATATSTSTNTDTDTTTADAAPVLVATALDLVARYSVPRAVRVQGLRETSLGSPIFYQGKMVGVLQTENAGANAQWIFKK